MKKVKHSLKLIVCLLIACSNTFAQTEHEEECEVVITRADLERCAVYKRTNELLERELKFKVVETVSLKDSCDKKEEMLFDSIRVLIQKNFNQNLVLAKEKQAKENNKTWGLYMTIAFVLSILFIVLRSKIAKFLPFLMLISFAGFAQPDPAYRPPVSINLQKGIRQTILYDTTSNSFSIVSVRDTHRIGMPISKLALTAKFNNVTIIDSATFMHSMNSQKLAVMFFENQTKETLSIDWFPDTTNTIKVYLPYRDKPTKYKFVGDVYIFKRY